VPRSDVEIALVRWIASVWGQSWFVDHLAVQMVFNGLFRSIPCVAILAGYWVATDATDRGRAVRTRVLGGFLASGVAMVLSRLFQNLVYSPRPVHDPVLGPLFAPHLHTILTADFHSFPSDHAAFLVPLVWAAGALQPSLGAATGALLLAALLARAWTGLHYPTDLLAGAVLGLALAWVERLRPATAAWGVDLVDRARSQWPVTTGTALFLIAYLYAAMFEPLREAVGAIGHLLGQG
jgi:undecaprenyl-diphosphatase